MSDRPRPTPVRVGRLERAGKSCVGPAVKRCSAFQGHDAGPLTLSWHPSDTLFLFSQAARVKSYSLLFPAPGFPRKTLPGPKQEAGSRNETSPFPLYAPFYPHPGGEERRRRFPGPRWPSRSRVTGGEAALLQ